MRASITGSISPMWPMTSPQARMPDPASQQAPCEARGSPSPNAVPMRQHWRDKDNGIWEVRDERAHYIQSKGLCWVALDRACDLGKSGLIPDHSERWRAAADELRAWVDEHGWDDQLQSYVRAPELREVDASMLTLAVFGYESERMDATIAAVDRELREGPYVYRYRGGDGLQGDEGAFLTCSFWLVDASPAPAGSTTPMR